MKDDFKKSALEKFFGCDGGHPGSVDSAAIWIFGIEYANDNRTRPEHRPPDQNSDAFEVSTQLSYPYNRSAFKLLAAIEGRDVSDHERFAYERKPFHDGAKGYFKGNLYPIPCYGVSTWGPEAIEETGFQTKPEYEAWCDEHRLPTINRWVEEYRPKAFIGVGTTYEHQFSKAYFGEVVPLDEYGFTVNGHSKRILYKQDPKGMLVVVPHFAGSYGLNSDESLQMAGDFISSMMHPKDIAIA